MDSEILVVELYKALAKAGVRNRVERVRKIAREVGASFSNDDAAKWLAPLVNSEGQDRIRGNRGRFAGRNSGRTPDGTRTENDEEIGRNTDGKRTEPRTHTRGSQGKSKIVPIVQDELSLLTSFGVASAPPHTLWDDRINQRVDALGKRQIRSLDHREMHDMASAHALRFMARKARGEAAVRKAALGLSGRIRNVVSAKDHPSMHDLTVGEYFAFGTELWEAAGKQDWDTPWAVVAWAEAPESQAEIV